MPQVVLNDNHQSLVVYNSDTKIVTKTVRSKILTQHWFETYQRFQEKCPHVIKIYELKDKFTYTMEYIPNIIHTLDIHIKGNYQNMKKSEYINLYKAVNESMIMAMELSETLPEEYYWMNWDIKTTNIGVISPPGKDLKFMILDPDAWYATKGLTGIEGFLHAQLSLGLGMQIMLKL